MMLSKAVGVITHNYRRYEGETDDELIYRITNEKDKIGSWEDVAGVLNSILGVSYTESAYRKRRNAFDRMFNVYQEKYNSHLEELEDIKEQRRELEKERVKFRDERNEYNRLIRKEARKESFEEMVKKVICEDTSPININHSPISFISNNDLLVHLTDIHAGIEINSFLNTFNEDILKKRMSEYLSQILDIQKIHNSQNCYIVCGEIVSGIIHNNLRLQNNMDLMQQFKFVSELIAAMLIELSTHFNSIHFYITPGNHSRISPKKDDALDGENMDILLPFYLKARLQNIDNIEVHDNTIDPEIAMFSIRGSKIFAAHGHKDDPKTVVQNFTIMYGIRPDIVLLGHRHSNALTTIGTSKVIESGCIAGQDQFALSIRKYSRPEQTVSVITDKGFLCLYDVTLYS